MVGQIHFFKNLSAGSVQEAPLGRVGRAVLPAARSLAAAAAAAVGVSGAAAAAGLFLSGYVKVT